MYYAVKERLSKLDSNRYRNLPIQVVDMRLNEGQEIFIKRVAMPRNPAEIRLEVNQRAIDDIRNIIVPSKKLGGVKKFDESSVVVPLPEDYQYMIRGYATTSWRGCQSDIRIFPQQHGEEFEESPNTRSSYIMQRFNSVMISDSRLRVYHDSESEILGVRLDYIRRPAYIHNADLTAEKKYELLSGVTLEGHQDCELAPTCHSEIVDLTVMIIRGDISADNFQASIVKQELQN